MTMGLLPFGKLDRKHTADRLLENTFKNIKSGVPSDLTSEEQVYVLLYYFLAVVRRKNGLNRRYQYRESLLAELSALAWIGRGNSLDPIYDKLQELLLIIDQNPEHAKTIVSTMLEERTKQFSGIQRTRRKGNQPESALDGEIRKILKRKAEQSWREVVDKLERKVGAGVITEVTDTHIIYRISQESDAEARLAISTLRNKMGSIRKSISLGT